jgi:E3 ubiquitin-protein ligase HUWE1
MTTLADGGPSSLLARLLHQAVASLLGESAETKDDAQFADALFSLTAALGSHPDGMKAVVDAGLVPILLPLLKDTSTEHLVIVASALRILESFLQFS